MFNRFLPFFQFLPLSFFSTYAFWHGQVSNERWLDAFQVSALLAVVQLAYFVRSKQVMSRLILSANLYLILGGSAALLQQWWLFDVYEKLQESAIFLIMIVVGLLTTIYSEYGFVGVVDVNSQQIKKASTWLLLATVFALILSIYLQGQITLSTVVPIICLALMQRYLAFNITSPNRLFNFTKQVEAR
jgi:hypothetical protein